MSVGWQWIAQRVPGPAESERPSVPASRRLPSRVYLSVEARNTLRILRGNTCQELTTNSEPILSLHFLHFMAEIPGGELDDPDLTQVLRTTNPFGSHDLAAPRLVWDADVHTRLFSETCHFFLIRLQQFGGDSFERIEQLVQEAHVTAYCIYFVFGYYDMLLRIWATAGKRARLVEALNLAAEREQLVDETYEFQAQAVNYLWWPQRVAKREARNATTTWPEPLPDPNSHLPQIRLISDSIRAGDALNRELVKALISAGVLGLKSSYPIGSLKFFVAITPLPGRSVSTTERPVLEAVHAAFAWAKDVTIYRGFGFASYVVKGVALRAQDAENGDTTPEFDRVGRGALKLAEAIDPFGLRTMTLLVSNHDAPESERLDIEWMDLDASLVQLETYLGHAWTPRIVSLSRPARDQISAVFSDFGDLLRSPSRELLLEILKARIADNPAALSAALSQLAPVEGQLSAVLFRQWRSEFPTDWKQRVFDAAAETTTHPMPDLRTPELQLQGLINVGRKLSNAYLVGLLGDERWESLLRDYVNIRNHANHGLLLSDESIAQEYRDAWREKVTIALRVARLQNRLQEQLEPSAQRSSS